MNVLGIPTRATERTDREFFEWIFYFFSEISPFSPTRVFRKCLHLFFSPRFFFCRFWRWWRRWSWEISSKWYCWKRRGKQPKVNIENFIKKSRFRKIFSRKWNILIGNLKREERMRFAWSRMRWRWGFRREQSLSCNIDARDGDGTLSSLDESWINFLAAQKRRHRRLA